MRLPAHGFAVLAEIPDNGKHEVSVECIKCPFGYQVCIYGPSGSGKSTFIKLLYGILKPSTGNILFGGNDISKFHIRQTRKYIAYLNQNTTNLFNTTVLEILFKSKRNK